MDNNLSIQNEMLYFKEKNPSSIILTVSDSLMAPFYSKGDVVGGQKVMNENQFPLLHGHVCIIEAAHGGALYLRRVIKSDGRKVIGCTLNTDSNSHLPIIEEIEAFSIAQVTRHWHLSALVDIQSSGTANALPLESDKNATFAKGE